MSSLREVVSFLNARLINGLPGSLAHDRMRARPTGSARLKFEHTVPPRRGGVLILLYEYDGLVYFPLIQRPEYGGAHSGQISLPGGKAEPGEDIVTTALRECEEEVGVKRNEIIVVGRLSDFHVEPSNFIVTPVIGVMESTPVFIPDKFEVVRVITAGLNDIIDNGAIKQKEIVVGSGFQLMAPHFEIDGEVVWGATAMMLNELREILLERSA
jgi:8-oxo-dGTP pyrophosphatase MutT (NUDIX family)